LTPELRRLQIPTENLDTLRLVRVTQIKSVVDSSDISQGIKRQRIEAILRRAEQNDGWVS
jgi:hypothetical protein